jgi:hypothetical protein
MTRPRFETGDARYRWLNRAAAVGEGRLEPDIVDYRIFELVNGEAPPPWPTRQRSGFD